MKKNRVEVVSARSVLALHASARIIGCDIHLQDYLPDLDIEDRDAFVPLNQQISLVHKILQQKGETIGLDLGRNLPFDGLGFWGFLLRSSLCFGDMLYRAERYIRIVNKFPEFLLEPRGSQVAQICAHPEPSPFGSREQVVQIFLSHWLAWGRLLTHKSLAPVQASFTWAGPVDKQPFHDFYLCPVHFGASEDSLLFDKATLQTGFPDSSRQLAEEFANHAAVLIRQMTTGDEFLPRVCAAIEAGLANGLGHESDVADRMALTSRTLHRKLKSHDLSFRKLRDEVLVKKATNLLEQRNIPIAEISFLLGYAEVSTFYRAFKRWTGTVPRVWREQHCLQAGFTL